MNKKYLVIIGIVGIAALFLATGIYAGTTVPDVVKMDNKAYSKHKKGIVVFTHKKHVEEYKAGCGECHHDADNKPLDNLKMGDDVQNCIECHKNTGKKPKGEKLSKKEKIMKYHKEAIHANCTDCHKAFNKKKGFKTKDAGAAPTKSACAKCHPKKKK